MLGIAITGASNISSDLVSSNLIIDYSYVTQPFTLASDNSILRCISGLGPTGSYIDDFGDIIPYGNTVLGGWYFNGNRLFVPGGGSGCQFGHVFEVRGANGRNYPGVLNLYLCRPFTATEEGVYSCIMLNGSMMIQAMSVGVYFSGRSESLDMYLITSLLTIFYLYTAAPVIDPPISAVGVPLRMSVTLSCTSRNSPPDTFTFMKDGMPVTPTPSVTTVDHTNTTAVFRIDYTINSVGESDAGIYTCTVTNPIGSDSQTITVVIGKFF